MNVIHQIGVSFYTIWKDIKLLCAREAKQAMLRFHDYHLQKYEVSDHGKTAKLYLGFGYPGKETDFSEITFTEVAIYHFVHTAYSIITDIENVPISTLFENERDNLQARLPCPPDQRADVTRLEGELATERAKPPQFTEYVSSFLLNKCDQPCQIIFYV